MTIPFLNLFQKAKGLFRNASEPHPTPSARGESVEKSSAERLRKTVMPNVTRIVSTGNPDTGGFSSPGRSSRSAGLPPSVVLAIEPTVERTIALDLGDVIGLVPKEYLKPDEKPELTRRILIKASMVEKGMASGKPKVALTSLYDQVPEIFAREIAPSDPVEVDLPFDKVMAQFETARVREDQQCAPNVPQVETPILQVTLEDTARFGTKMEPLQGDALQPLKLEAASARSIANAEPESVVREPVQAHAKRSTIPLSEALPAAATPPKEKSQPAASSSTKIPFHLPPNGTGGPVSERVPASSGPPVPTSPAKPETSPKSELPKLETPPKLEVSRKSEVAPKPEMPSKPAAPAAPAKLPFKVPPPSDDLRPKLTLIPGLAKPPPNSLTESHLEPRVGLPLRPILQNVPPFQLDGDVSDLPVNVRIEFAFSLIQPQLAGGKVSIPAKTFRETLPEEYRKFFVIDDAETPVLLPLQDVLKNLPEGSLKMRGDQEHAPIEQAIETPFSIKAREDAERLSKGFTEPSRPAADKKVTIPIESLSPSKPAEEKRVTAKPIKPLKPAIERAVKAEKGAKPASEPSKADKTAESVTDPAQAKQPVVEAQTRDAKPDAKEVVSQATALAGVSGCSVSFSDGLILAQSFPEQTSVEALCAAAPSLSQRIEQHTRDTTFGALKAITLKGEKSTITFFTRGNICLTALHSVSELVPDTQSRLAEMAEQLNQTYTQQEQAHVDH